MGSKFHAVFSPNIRLFAGRVTAVLRENGLFYAAGLLAMTGLKYYYSHATADGLRWMLAPVAHLAGLLGGIHFQWQSHAGFVSHSREVVIAPACAGINFMIICFSAIFFSFVARLRGIGTKCGWIVVCFAASYLVTICVNTVRIIISIYLYSAPIYGGFLSPERVHCLAGTVIFVAFLVAVFQSADRFMRRRSYSGPPMPVTAKSGLAGFPSIFLVTSLPFAWYVLITVIVPLLNGAARRDGCRFAEHAALVTAAGLCICLIPVAVVAMTKKRVDISNKTKEKSGNG